MAKIVCVTSCMTGIAQTYMTDPAFAVCREDEKLWDVTVGDGLENL